VWPPFASVRPGCAVTVLEMNNEAKMISAILFKVHPSLITLLHSER
jgi:hypothetical protein